MYLYNISILCRLITELEFSINAEKDRTTYITRVRQIKKNPYFFFVFSINALTKNKYFSNLNKKLPNYEYFFFY